MNFLFKLYKLLIGLVAFSSSLVSIILVALIILKRNAVPIIIAALVISFILAIYEASNIYEKGIGKIIGILLLIQIYCTLLANHLGSEKDYSRYMAIIKEYNRTQFSTIFCVLAVAVLIYIVGYGLCLLARKENQRKEEIL